jgi:hypothetical protein
MHPSCSSLRSILFAAVVALSGCGGGGSNAVAPAVPEVIGRVDTTSVSSTNTGFAYPISIYLPQSYAAGVARYPTIYVIEGDALFSTGVDGLPESRFNAFKRAMQRRSTQAILVGIGGTARRGADFLLPGASSYHDFLVKELIPNIEAQYRTNSAQRALSGLSHGGYFVNVALFAEGTVGALTFSHFLSVETSAGAANDVPAYFALEQQMYDSGHPVPTTLYLAAGTSGVGTNGALVDDLYQRMIGRKYAGLLIVKAEFGTGHAPTDLPAFEDALSRFFP